MRRHLRAFASEAGQAAVVMALSMSGMLLGAGLAIDTGQLFVARRDAQAAADAAAWAGAVELRNGATSAEAIAAATADATANGFTDGGNTSVTVSNPPTTGIYAGNDEYVEVVIAVEVETALMPNDLTTVTVRGVAGVAPIGQDYAIVSLDDANTSGALRTSPQGSLTVSGGGIMINSSSTSAGTSQGTVSIADPYGTDVVGNATGTWPNKQTGQDPLPDPYLNFPLPDTDGVTDHGSPVCCTLQPGIYTGTISGNNAWVLQPGTYILKGVGIDLAGNSSLNGTGVFIFLTTSMYPAEGGTCPDPSIKLTGNNASVLTPPTSGTYENMLIYQDPACAGDIRVGGNGAITGTGTIYAPSASVQGNGNNAVIALSQVVSKHMDAQNADFTFNYSSATAAAPRIPALSE